jgi:hypothetical protein
MAVNICAFIIHFLTDNFIFAKKYGSSINDSDNISLFARSFINRHKKTQLIMYWTLELAYHLEDAPWPASRDELIDYAIRSGAPVEVIENLQQMEDEDEIYEGIEDIWPDYPRREDFLFNDDEY